MARARRDFGCRLDTIGPAEPDSQEVITWSFESPEVVAERIREGSFLQLMHLGSLYLAKQGGFWG